MIHRRPTFIALLLGGWLVAGVSTAQAQTAVQLPTFNIFTVNTTVSVPDRGGALLGGVNRSSEGRSEFGVGPVPMPFRNQGIGSSKSATNMSVTATIHDLREMDQEILSRSNYVMRDPAEALPMRQLAGAREAVGPPSSIAAIQQQKSLEKFAEQQDALASFEKGLKAEETGKHSIAKIHYQMALKRATGDLRAAIEERLAGMSRPASTSGVARSGE